MKFNRLDNLTKGVENLVPVGLLSPRGKEADKMFARSVIHRKDKNIKGVVYGVLGSGRDVQFRVLWEDGMRTTEKASSIKP